MSRLMRDGTAEHVSLDKILRHVRGQGNIHFPCSADPEQDWQPYPVDPYSAICDEHTYIQQHIGEVRSKILNPERGFYRIVELENEIDYELKAFQDWQPQLFPIVACVYSNHFYGRTMYVSET